MTLDEPGVIVDDFGNTTVAWIGTRNDYFDDEGWSLGDSAPVLHGNQNNSWTDTLQSHSISRLIRRAT